MNKQKCKHKRINKITGLCLKCGYNTYRLTIKEYKILKRLDEKINFNKLKGGFKIMEIPTKAESIIKNTKTSILNNILDELRDIDGEKEIYFHDIIHQEVDSNTPQIRTDCLSLIDTAETKHFDEGLIDKSSLNRTLITMAYCSIEQNLFNDDFMQELQDDLNNETITTETAKELIKKIEKHKKQEGLNRVVYTDYESQVFLKVNFEFGIDDFKPFVEKGFLNKSQLIDLSGGVKILTSNKSLNQNALMIEKAKNNLIRVYLMEKDSDLDIRNLFKLDCISEETGFNLSPSAYLEQTTEQYEQDKKSFSGNRKNYLSEFKNKKQFLKHIVKISQKLTERTI